MGKYPVNIHEEDNKKLKYPFLLENSYTSIVRSPEGPVILLRRSKEKLTKSDITKMIEINRGILSRRVFSEQNPED